MPFKIRTKLFIAFIGLIMVIMMVSGFIGYYLISTSHRALHKVEAIAEEIIVTGDLHRSLEHVLMPANDYLVTGDRKYIDDFNVLSKRVEEAFKKTDELLGHLEAFGLPHVEEGRKTLKDIKTAWLNIKELSLKILSIPNPIGNKDGARMMEEMDYRWGGPATELIHKWQKGDVEKYKEAVELAEKARRTSWVIMGSAGTLLLALGAGFAVFYSKLFVRPIKKLHNGADAIAGGDFKTRLDVKTGDELEQLSNAMNEMAEKLDDFYVTLENQVMERTRELQESEERYRILGITAPNAIICLKAPDTITFWNRRATEIFGYSEEEAIGKTMHDLIVPERYKEKAGEGLKNFFQTGTGPIVGKKTELSALRKDGSEFPIELSLSIMKIGGNWQATGIVRDITERKQMEEAIKKERDYSKSLVETANAIILTLDTDGKIVIFNHYMEELSGYKLDEVKGKDWFTTFLPERDHDRIRSVFKEAINGISTKGNVNPILTRDGREVVIEWYANTIKDLDGKIVGLLSIGQDITERKKAEEELKRKFDEIKRMNRLMVDREIKMAELKKENQRLRDEAGKKVNG